MLESGKKTSIMVTFAAWVHILKAHVGGMKAFIPIAHVACLSSVSPKSTVWIKKNSKSHVKDFL